MQVSVRQISGDDWAAFRALRLRALADAPDAFGIMLARALANPEAAWRARADGPGLLLIAFAGELPVAMGGLHAPEESPDAYVWAQHHDRAVSLHITEGNDGARRLYEAQSFEPTGEWQLLREGSELRIETLRWRP